VTATGTVRGDRLTEGPRHLWHVVLTVGGEPCDLETVRSGLERLRVERPFLLTCRYAGDRAEVRYWEEARDLDDAAALALRLWGEHRVSAGLPPWTVVGLEVLHRDAFRRRAKEGNRAAVLVPAGGVRPF
jgi:hypothetical protein